ncbi:uncharacterized protein LOC130992528 [Salvia miltiorrhiza]|uniref:uncharacterized protein LOC130992528 n=1 Tax=Salvia miltiorrhiza TaxID=226208 RepID=UPI0025AB767D|nr:uncharacterized protein LOC130992528 [Salvia miltiorrhiza]
MNGFEKGLSPSKSNANRNFPSSGSVENDENDSSVDKLIPQFANNEIAYGKHFMSGVARKKILAEIKGNPSICDAQAHKNSNLDLESSPPKRGICNSSVKVYDPLTNYLSPRPRYLRFNPNRRREILKRFEKELNSSLDSEEASDEEEIADSSLSPPKGSVVDGYEAVEEEIADSSRSPPKGNDVNQRNGVASDEGNGSVVDGYESEEEEMEKGWCLRGISKLLFTLIACLLLTSYISPMNSPTDLPTQQAIWDFKDSGVVIKNQTLEFFSTNLHGNSFFEVEDGGNNSIEEAEVEEESYGGYDESIEAGIVEYLEWQEKEMAGNENVNSEDNSIEELEVEEENGGETDESIEAEIVEYLEWHDEKEMIGNENVDSQDVADEAAEFEGVRDARFEFEADESEHLIDAKTDENLDGGILLDMEVVSSYTGLDEDNVNKDEAAETEIIGSGVDTNAFSLVPVLEEIPTESKGADDTRSVEELVVLESHEELSDSTDEVGMEKSEWNTVVGVSAVLLVVSTSIAIIYSRKSRSSTSSKGSDPVLKQKLAAEGNVLHQAPVLHSIDRKVEFLARASLPSSHSKLASHIHAPTVELIGEIVVGQPSRVGNSGKFQMIVSEDMCKRGSRPQVVVPASSQPSAVSFTPRGSFTTERKISKKEGGQSREAMIVPTPVRRSSRLRNRTTIMSP